MTTNRQTFEEALGSVLQNGPLLERVQKLQRLRTDPEIALRIDTILLERMACQEQALHQVGGHLEEVKQMLDDLTAPPWFPATFVRMIEEPAGRKAMVRDGAGMRLVGIEASLDPAALQPCDEVYLSHNQNVILGRISHQPSWRAGETCAVKQCLPDNRLLVASRGESVVLIAPPQLAGSVREGDLVLCDLTAHVAIERVERPTVGSFLLETTPHESFADIGGLDTQIAQMREALLLHWEHPETARKYGLPRLGSILLCGPPGTGKTFLARAFANFMASLSASGKALFMSIKPGELHSSWYSESERNYREVFRQARERGTAEQPCALFLDELDAVGSSRGQSHMRVHDNVLTALIAELDGLNSRGNVLVIGATNRRDSLDPALARPGRMGDLILDVPRPNRRSARAIFAKHLEPHIPFARNGCGDDHAATRNELIDAAVSSIYAPNAEDLATLVFRDGSRRGVRPPDLISGAVIANICRHAKRKACRREIARTDNPGVTAEDLEIAIDEEFATAAKGLTPANCRQHLEVPQDLDLVKVEISGQRLPRATRYLQTA